MSNVEKKHIYQNKDRYAFIVGLVIGMFVFVLIYGFSIINPTNTEWLLHSDDYEGSIDLTQHYMGWVYYRDTPWSFPLGLTEGIYSEPVSVVYTDSIPLFAVFFKIFSGILPASFQYMGLFGLLCYALMGGFGALITRRFSSNILVNVISAFFFVLSPILLNRMYLHTALSAHFLIVAGIVLWLYRDRMKRAKYIGAWTALLTCGTLINAYFTPILLGILLCSIVQDLINGEKISRCIMPVVIPLVVTLFFAWMVGMFYGETNASGSGGLDILSFNMDAFFNPATYATDFGHFTHDFKEISYSGLVRGYALVTPYQNEGFAYLGLGMIILVILAIILLIAYLIRRARIIKRDERIGANTSTFEKEKDGAKKGVSGKEKDSAFTNTFPGNKRKTVSYVVALLIYMVVFTFLALSPTWTLGGRELFSIPYPEFIWNLLSIFRSTGRFIWPVYYMIMTLALLVPTCIFARTKKETYASKLFPKRKVFLIEKAVVILLMALCLLTQVIDLSAAMKQKHDDFHKTATYESDLKSQLWEQIAKKCDTIVVYPPTQDLYWDGISALEFEIFAKQHGMSMNMTYMSRDLTAFADEKTRAEFEERKNGKTFPNHMYLFLSAKENELPDANTYNLNYYRIDGYIVGLDKSVKLDEKGINQ
ncbi:MAG: DUF6311 domain-containing protein [Lachnospiraceae bacterium]|nr:DUF6311 domain-containing protein [Lachnospiraceae bacterium]